MTEPQAGSSEILSGHRAAITPWWNQQILIDITH